MLALVVMVNKVPKMVKTTGASPFQSRCWKRVVIAENVMKATEILEPVFKVAEADEEQKVDGVQRWGAPKVQGRASSGAT